MTQPTSMPSTPGASITASLASSRVMPPTDGFDALALMRGRGVVSGSPHRAAPHRVARRENVLVAQPGARPRQPRGRAREPARVVFEAPRPPFAAGGSERTQALGLADAVLMVGDRLLPTGVGVDRLGGGSHLQGGEPQDLPVNLHGAPGGDICRAHARRRPGRRPPSEWGGPRRRAISRRGDPPPGVRPARPVSGSVSASDLPDAAVQLHCLDPHGAGTLTPSLGLCPCQQGAAGVQHGRVSACVDCGT